MWASLGQRDKPPWKVIGKASELGEEVYIMEGAYYNARGRVLAGPGTFMFNAPGARHGGISCELTLYIHCCSGEPDEIISIELIDFDPKTTVSEFGEASRRVTLPKTL